MEHPYLFFVKLFELIGLGHFAHTYTHVVYTWVVMTLLIIFGIIAGRKTNLIPTKMQNVFELLISAMEDFMVDVAGEDIRWFFPFLATIFLYVFISNLLGLIPGFFSPTANLNTTASCALVVVLFTHAIGIKRHGFKYIKHFLGPVWWLSPLILPIEIIQHCARVLSLSFRLFGNMMGHEIVLGILFLLAGLFLAPLPVMVLGIFVALVQAFVIFLLSIIYFMGAMEEAH